VVAVAVVLPLLGLEEMGVLVVEVVVVVQHQI
jgi:hypothetical protein